MRFPTIAQLYRAFPDELGDYGCAFSVRSVPCSRRGRWPSSENCSSTSRCRSRRCTRRRNRRASPRDIAGGVGDELPLADLIIDPDEIDELVMASLPQTSLFSARFRECSARALLLPRRRLGQRTPLWQQRQRASNLLSVASKYPTFPMLLETSRECLQDVFDLPALREVLTQLRSRAIRVVSVDTAKASPFAELAVQLIACSCTKATVRWPNGRAALSSTASLTDRLGPRSCATARPWRAGRSRAGAQLLLMVVEREPRRATRCAASRRRAVGRRSRSALRGLRERVVACRLSTTGVRSWFRSAV